VGTLQVSRVVSDPKVADEVLEQGIQNARMFLELGDLPSHAADQIMVVPSRWRCAGAEALGPWMDDASSPPRMRGPCPFRRQAGGPPGGIGVSPFARACVTDCRDL
jgi:hypothetical protein